MEGLSQRQIAAVIRVDEKTVRHDLNADKSAKSAENSALLEAPASRGKTGIINDAKRIRAKNERMAAIKVETPREAFETIVIDPPWPTTKIERDVRPNQVEFDYPTMNEDELRALPLKGAANHQS